MKWIISLESSKPFKMLKAFSDPIYSLQFNPLPKQNFRLSNDDNLPSSQAKILSSSEKGYIIVTDYDTGKTILRFRAHRVTINQIAWHPNESKILTCSDDRTLRVFDSQTGSEYAVFPQTGAYVHRCSFSSCGRFILSSHFDHSVRVWDLEDRKEVLKITHEMIVFCANFSAQDDLIFTGHRWGKIQLFDRSGLCLKSANLRANDFLRCCQFFDNDRKILTGSDEGFLGILDAHTFQFDSEKKAHQGWIHNLAVFQQYKAMSGSEHDGVKIWDLRTFECLQFIPQPCTAVSIDPTSSKLVLGTKQGELLVYPVLHPERGQALLLLCLAREFERGCCFDYELLPDELFMAILEYSNLLM